MRFLFADLVLVGCLPSHPTQNQFLGIPALLMPEQVALGLKHGKRCPHTRSADSLEVGSACQRRPCPRCRRRRTSPRSRRRAVVSFRSSLQRSLPTDSAALSSFARSAPARSPTQRLLMQQRRKQWRLALRRMLPQPLPSLSPRRPRLRPLPQTRLAPLRPRSLLSHQRLHPPLPSRPPRRRRRARTTLAG